MKKVLYIIFMGLLMGTVTTAQDKLLPAAVSSKAVIVVSPFTTTKEVAWPYDMKELQRQTVAEMTAKAGAEYDVSADAPQTPQGHVYVLSGEVFSWHPGNRAKRMLVGMGSGRETADIHYWLTDESGKKVFDNKDTIRAEFWGNAYAGSVGELAHPFADKISGRIKNAKLK
ncbi:MAG TPA: DUF4410 domain-containing protein [Candidatus Acidoferrum sp.]|jgi:hypothetical protein